MSSTLAAWPCLDESPPLPLAEPLSRDAPARSTPVASAMICKRIGWAQGRRKKEELYSFERAAEGRAPGKAKGRMGRAHAFGGRRERNKRNARKINLNGRRGLLSEEPSRTQGKAMRIGLSARSCRRKRKTIQPQRTLHSHLPATTFTLSTGNEGDPIPLPSAQTPAQPATPPAVQRCPAKKNFGADQCTAQPRSRTKGDSAVSCPGFLGFPGGVLGCLGGFPAWWKTGRDGRSQVSGRPAHSPCWPGRG
jgi:hypothetical protein